MDRIIDHFRLGDEREDVKKIIENVDSSVEFKGTNLWILVFAIFIASLGLNVNSTAVVIGAMLVSPLMGPPLGLGLGMAINDLALLRRSFANFLFAMGAGLIASTIYFAVSPLKDASTEILARTSPNVYDVLIALFGGFAGILAMSSRKKANVIPGVAIATALMPPLCTAGYGLANWDLAYLGGALYLFVINTVFIALATLLTARFLHFPFKHLPEPRDEIIAKRVVWAVVVLTVLPSLYFAYDIIRQNRFRQRANHFVEAEAAFSNDYLLKKTIDASKHEITLTYGGEFIEPAAIESLRAQMPKYDLADAKLKIQQGFSYLKNVDDGPDADKTLQTAISDRDAQIHALKGQIDDANAQTALGQQVFAELKTQYPQIVSCVVQQVTEHTDSDSTKIWLAVIGSKSSIDSDEQKRIEDWLKVRLDTADIHTFFPTPKPGE